MSLLLTLALNMQLKPVFDHLLWLNESYLGLIRFQRILYRPFVEARALHHGINMQDEIGKSWRIKDNLRFLRTDLADLDAY